MPNYTYLDGWSLEKTFPGGSVGWFGVVGLAENKANSAPLELELGLSLAKQENKEDKKLGKIVVHFYHCQATSGTATA